MTLPAVEMAPSSASPLPEGAIAPPSGDGAPDAAPSTETPGTKSAASEVAPTKPPAASLISIATKGKSSGGPAKTGDLTRFFELARRQADTAPAGPNEPTPAVHPAAPVAQLDIAPPPVAAVSSPIDMPAVETPVVETPVTPVSFETTAVVEPPPVSPPAEPVIAPESTVELSFPLMLAPPQAMMDADAAKPAHVELAPALTTESDFVAVPDWVKAVSTVGDIVAPETAEPIETMPIGVPAALIEPRPAAVVPVESVTAQIPTAPRPPAFKELVDYWRSLRHGDDHPAAESIDRNFVTERWPGSLLMSYMPASQDPRGELRPTRVTRLGTASSEAQSVAEVGSHSTEWMLEVARTALVNDEPVEEQQRLDTLTGVAGFRMVALPLGPTKGLPDAVLCILMPGAGAPRFGKRRIWL